MDRKISIQHQNNPDTFGVKRRSVVRSYALSANDVTTPAVSETAISRAGLQSSASANLDLLRALAVLLVLADHVLDVIGRKYEGYSVHPYDWAIGRLGVLLFFVHTSLVLNYSMSRLGLSGFVLFRSFLIRRAFRLYPLSILCVLIVVVFQVPSMPWDQFEWRGWGNLVSNLALTTNLTFSRPMLGPLWSLPIEAQMYVALPFVFMILGSARSPVIAIGLWTIAVLIAPIQPALSDRLNVFGFAPFFIAGVVAYSFAGRWQKRIIPSLWLPFLLALIAGYLYAQRAIADTYNVWLQSAFCFAAGFAIPLFADSRSRLLNFVGHTVAKYSYGVYLFHCVALWVGCELLASYPPAVQWGTALATLVLMSVSSYHLIEDPMIRMGAKIAKSLEGDVREQRPGDSKSQAEAMPMRQIS